MVVALAIYKFIIDMMGAVKVLVVLVTSLTDERVTKSKY
jgi:hypothetical protein